MLLSDYVDVGVITTPQDFISNNEIEKRFVQAINNKKSKQVIYFHHSITPTLVRNVKNFFKNYGVKITYVLFDPNQELKGLHKAFDEIQL